MFALPDSVKEVQSDGKLSVGQSVTSLYASGKENYSPSKITRIVKIGNRYNYTIETDKGQVYPDLDRNMFALPDSVKEVQSDGKLSVGQSAISLYTSGEDKYSIGKIIRIIEEINQGGIEYKYTFQGANCHIYYDIPRNVFALAGNVQDVDTDTQIRVGQNVVFVDGSSKKNGIVKKIFKISHEKSEEPHFFYNVLTADGILHERLGKRSELLHEGLFELSK